MPKLPNRIYLTLITAIMSAIQIANAQSPDSRNCNCFTGPVSADFMLATKAIYGSLGIVLRRNDLLKPSESQLVKFVIPRLTAKKGCGAVYRIYITDESNNLVHETEDSYNEFTYAFNKCSKTYTVKLMASGISPAGGDGNCSRSISFRVKPQCNTTSCNCYSDDRNAGGSGDLNVDGKVICLTPSDRFRRYSFQYKIINKTDCNLRIESISMIGNSLGSSTEPILPKSTSVSFNMGFTTALTTASPSGGKVGVTVRYSLNGKKCSINMDMPYEGCR